MENSNGTRYFGRAGPLDAGRRRQGGRLFPRCLRRPASVLPAAPGKSGGEPMSDSQTVTIPAVEHAATAETRPARLLKALAQNPEPLSTRRWPASWPNQASAKDCRPPTTGLCDARASRPRRTGRPGASQTRPARHHLAHYRRRSRLARRTRQSSSPRRGRRISSTAQNRTGPAHGHRTGPRAGPGPRRLQPRDSTSQPQPRRSPAQRTRLYPRPDRRGLPRQQRENPPGPPLGSGGGGRR
jgi:hypothetical protein